MNKEVLIAIMRILTVLKLGTIAHYLLYFWFLAYYQEELIQISLLRGLTAVVTWATGPGVTFHRWKRLFYAFDFSLIKFVRYWFWLMRLIIKQI